MARQNNSTGRVKISKELIIGALALRCPNRKGGGVFYCCDCGDGHPHQLQPTSMYAHHLVLRRYGSNLERRKAMGMTTKQTKPEICYECYYFRERTAEMAHLCVNPQSYWCDRQGIGKATRACHHGRLNPKLIELYPHRYELPQHQDTDQTHEEG